MSDDIVAISMFCGLCFKSSQESRTSPMTGAIIFIMLLLCLMNNIFLVSGANSFKAFDDANMFHLKWPGTDAQELFPDETSQNSLLMTTVNQEQYVCVLPTESYSESASEEYYEGPTPFELLKPLFSQTTCSYRLEQYWAYELCHGRHLRQYHEESTFQGVRVQEYSLGRFDTIQLEKKTKEHLDTQEKIPTVRVGESEAPHLAFNLTGGTLCDLNGLPRSSRVLYACQNFAQGSRAEFQALKEVSSCEYEVVFFTPLLCSHPKYRHQDPPENAISCHTVGQSPPKPSLLSQMEGEGLEYFDQILSTDEDDPVQPLISPPPPPPPPLSATSGGEVYPHDPKLLQDFLSGSYCLQGGSGWWKYEFCFGKKVEQFHEDYSRGRVTLVLGTWDKASHLAWLEEHPHKKPQLGLIPKQVSHFYGGGSICDVTSKPRQVEVKLKCQDVGDRIDMVSLYLLEPRTCEYVLMVESGFLCNLVQSADENGLFD